MYLSTIDWLIIVAYFLLTFLVGLYFTKTAGKNMTNFFLGGRNLPWWLAGLSMVATTFAADTPLAVTELVVKYGIAGNWLWWNALSGGMLTVFFFAKYWRRAEIITDIELVELRYSGKAAAFLRGFRAIYMGLFINAIVIGWVNIALMSLLQVFFEIPQPQLIWYVAAAMVLVVIYSSLSGLLGVVWTDAVQFVIAMVGTIVLAFVVVNSDKIGGITALQNRLPAWSLSFFPQFGTVGSIGTTLTLGFGSFFAFVGVQWWASWYPGAEPGGGGYIAQRMMSAKNEQHAVYATLFFQIAHYCLRPWPWILVGLCTIILYPQLSADDKKLGYVMAMKEFLPSGLRGLLLVAFLAAYMSTISTQINWGASYLVNDFYKRFINKGGSEKSLVFASRIATLLMMVFSLIVTTQISTIAGTWAFIVECGAGLGLVLILRWYWWRINAWSEIVATIAPFIAYGFSKYYLVTLDPAWGKPLMEDPRSYFLTVGFTTVAWIVATWLTAPTDIEKLQDFYIRIQPEGSWRPVRESLDMRKRPREMSYLIFSWLFAIVLAYTTLFLIGELIFMRWLPAGIYAFIWAFSIISLNYLTKKIHIFDE